MVVMWAERDNFAQGEFAFFSPCIDPATNGFTSTVSNTVPCNQHHTTNAKIGKHGSAVTVSPSYQLSYASLPWMAAGTMGGLTLKKQFEKAFALHSGGTLDYLMVGTFNEHIAQPQPNPWPTNPAAMSMGMERDLFNKSLWVDMYGLRSRDLEPATEDGGYTWKIFESCMRVFRSKAAACSDTSELCCSTDTHTEPRLLWTPIWSFENAAGSNGSAGSAASDGAGAVTDNLLTADSVERALLLKANWTEICTPLGGSDQFCAGSYGSDPTPTRWEQGPFALHKSPLNLPLASTAVYRCTTTGTEGGGAVPAAAAAGVHTEDDGRLPKGLHFFSSSRACRGIGKMEATLGEYSYRTLRVVAACIATNPLLLSSGNGVWVGCCARLWCYLHGWNPRATLSERALLLYCAHTNAHVPVCLLMSRRLVPYPPQAMLGCNGTRTRPAPSGSAVDRHCSTIG